MKLADVVKSFTTEIFTDAYGVSALFQGKLIPFTDITNSGSSANRRLLRTTPEIIIPAKRVISTGESIPYILGSRNIDYWNGEPIRHTYPAIPAQAALVSVTSVSILLEAAQEGVLNYLYAPDGTLMLAPDGTPMYTESQELIKDIYTLPVFVKQATDEESMSDVYINFDLYFSNFHNFARDVIVNAGDEFYRLFSDSWVDTAGFTVAKGIKIEAPLRQFNISVSNPVEYDNETDKYVSEILEEVLCFVEPLTENYSFSTISFDGIEPGDKAISVLKVNAPKLPAGTVINEQYRVVSVRDGSTMWVAQCRRLS